MVRRLIYLQLLVRCLLYPLPLVALSLATLAYLPFRLERILFWESAPLFAFAIGTTIAWMIAVEAFGLASIEDLLVLDHRFAAALGAAAFSCLAGLMLVYVLRWYDLSRFLLLTCLPLTFGLYLAIDTFLRSRVRRKRPAVPSVRVLVVGADHFGATAGYTLKHSPLLQCDIAGFARLPGQDLAVEGQVFEMNELSRFAFGTDFDEIVLALHPDRFGELSKVLEQLEPLSIPIRAFLRIETDHVPAERVLNMGEYRLVTLRTSPAESSAYLVLKRAFDVMFAGVVLVVLAPLMLLIAAIIRLDSRGPALFVQERVGLNGRLFRMYKFRTMRVGTAQEADTRWTTGDDPRRTRFGRFLRETSLDELPQFINVLRGEMSVVGPRPERPYFVGKFIKEVEAYNVRHFLKVGITGWAQVNGWRGDTCIPTRVAHDLYYVQNWSFFLDMRIIGMTVFRGLFSRNAY